MKHYILYGQVQERLDEHVKKHGEPYSFYEAVRELWAEGAFLTAPEVPSPDFYKWNTASLDDFDKFMNQAPVHLELFPIDKLAYTSARLASQTLSKFDVLPMKIADNQAMGLHRHDAFEMTYILKGRAKLYLDKNSRIASAGELCLMAPHFYHDVVPERGALVVSVTFWEHTIENTLFKLLKGENIISDFFRTNLNRRRQGFMLFNLPISEISLRIIRDIFQEGYSKSEYARSICASYIEILFSYLLRHYAENIDRGEEAEKDSDGSSILSVLKYIQANYRETSLKSVAQVFHYEMSYLGKKIKRQTGKNFTEIISELRLRKARELLRDTGMSIDEVAEASGFNNRVHFSRSFKESAGLSPAAYRKQNQSNKQPEGKAKDLLI